MIRKSYSHQFGVVFLFVLTSFIAGCEDDTIFLPPPTHSSLFDLDASQYSKDYYFVDTLYRKYWEPLHSSVVVDISEEMQAHQILQLDVWQSVNNIGGQYAGIAVIKKAFIDLPPHLIGTSYAPGFTDGLDTTSSGRYAVAYWIKLGPNKDYEFDSHGGFVILNAVNEVRAYAVSYTILGEPANDHGGFNSLVYGDSVPGTGESLLKLIKPIDLGNHPEYKPAWDLMLKNVYRVGERNLARDSFDLVVVRKPPSGPETYQIFNQPLLTILGLDRYDGTLAEHPDGLFDFIPKLTIDPTRGDILFPTLRPFDQGIVDYFRSHTALSDLPDSVLFPEVYDTTAYAAQHMATRTKYVIHTRITR